jgi:hypothetical protein
MQYRYYLLAPLLLFSLSCLNDGDEASYVGRDLCELVEACNNRGTCDASTGAVVCTCDTGFSGENCTECEVGYHAIGNSNCEVDEDCSASDPCQNGTCNDAGGIYSCACEAGWSGNLCDTCAAGWHDEAGDCVLDFQCMETTCSGAAAEASCSDTDGVIACECNPEYTGTFCESCNTDNHRNATGACVADDQCAVADPCVNGTCSDAGGIYGCACDVGWAGDFCDTCAVGFQDQAGECVLVECLGDADCDDALFCNGTETCDTGALCLAGIPVTCSGNGTCNEGTDSCDCSGGALGADCSTLPPLPVVSNLDVDCSEDPACFTTSQAVYFETFDVSPSIGAACTISFSPNDFSTGLGAFVLDEASSTQTFGWAPGTVQRTVTVSVQCSNAAGNSNTESQSVFVLAI